MDNRLDPSANMSGVKNSSELVSTFEGPLIVSVCHKRGWISSESALWNGCRGKQQMLSEPRRCLALSQILSPQSRVFMPESLQDLTFSCPCCAEALRVSIPITMICMYTLPTYPNIKYTLPDKQNQRGNKCSAGVFICRQIPILKAKELPDLNLSLGSEGLN